MLPLQYTIASTTAPIIFYLPLQLLLLNYDTGLTQGYVLDLAHTSKKYYETASPEELTMEEAALQHETKDSQPETTTTELPTNLPTKLFDVDESNAVIENNMRKKVGMLVRITPRMINYCARELKRMFQKELENEQIAEFSRILMRLNVSVLAPRFHNVTIPRFSYKVFCNDTVEIILRGGSARFQSSYRAVYKTVREGSVEANMSNFVITMKFKITTTFAGKLLLENMACGAEVRSIDVKLTPKLHELVNEGLRVELDETISVAICETLEIYMNKFEERLNKLIRSPLIDVKIGDILERLLIDTTISNGISLSEDYFDFPLLGTPTVSKLQNGVHPLMKSPDDKSKMVYVYVSEFVMNTFLKQLDTFDDMTLQLNTEPEFQEMLRLNCSENVECVGDFLQDSTVYENDSGRLIIKMRSPIIASLREGFALVDLHLMASVSYKQEDVDVKVFEFEFIVTLRVSNQFLNEQLAQEREAVRKTNATLQLVELAVSSVIPYAEMTSNFDEHLLQLIVLRKKSLEKLLTQQCSLIAVSPSSLYKAVSRTGAFRNRTLVIATGLEWTPELLQHFNLFS